jgi:hypothetical protein
MHNMSRNSGIAAARELIRTYPDWFNPESAWWAISIEDGWAGLVLELFKDINASLTLEQRAVFQVLQIKEKFGSLRFYYNPHTAAVDALVAAATEASMLICQRCGARGKLGEIHGWWATLCDDCHASCAEERG